MVKNQTITIRVTDEVKVMFMELAKDDNRSMANMFEVLVKQAYTTKKHTP